MKFLVVLALAVACASADVPGAAKDYVEPILRSSFDSSPEGNFNYEYETGNKIIAAVSGVVKDPNSDNPNLEIRGSYSYISPDGTPVETSYVANAEGFQPTGSHIPVAPAIPEAIARSLQYIAEHPPKVTPYNN